MTTTTTEALAALVREMQEKPYSPEWNDRALSTLAQLEAERAAPAEPVAWLCQGGSAYAESMLFFTTPSNPLGFPVYATPAAPSEDARDAARFRYLLGEDSDWTICEWDHDAGYWVSDQREPDVVRAAVDAAMQAQEGGK